MSDVQRSVGELIDRTVRDVDGDKIGTAFDVYVDDRTGQPEWLAVTTGLFGTKVSFVPIADATFVDDDVVVAYGKDVVKDAPRAEPDGHLSTEEEAALYAHYGRSADVTTETGAVPPAPPAGVAAGTAGTAGTDEAMTRSEEELDVQKRTQQAGRARLRKWVETEDVQFTVPVRREKAVLVTEPITDANRDAAVSGPDLTDAEHEVVLSEEVVDVDKRVVPKERVRLATETETDEVAVDEEVRKERITFEQAEGETERP